MAHRAVADDLPLEVAGDAETHVVDVVHLVDLRHAAHVPVARGARGGAERLDVALVREVGVAREVVHPHPLDGLLVVPGLAQLLDLGLGRAVASGHHQVAAHARLHGRDARLGRDRHRVVAVLALDLELTRVDVVAEEDRLARPFERSGIAQHGGRDRVGGGLGLLRLGGGPPIASRAASPPAPMPPRTRANVRIIDPPLRENRCCCQSFVTSCTGRRTRDVSGPEGRRSIFVAFKYTTRKSSALCANPSALLGYLVPLLGAVRLVRSSPPAAELGGAVRGRPLAQPFRLAAGKAQKTLHGPPLIERQPAPLEGSGSLSLVDGPDDVGRDAPAAAQPVLLGLAHRERHREPVTDDVDPAQLSIAHPVLPRPAPARAHEAHRLGHVLERHESGPQRLEPGRGGRGQILEGSSRRGRLRFVVVAVARPVGARPTLRHGAAPAGPPPSGGWPANGAPTRWR